MLGGTRPRRSGRVDRRRADASHAARTRRRLPVAGGRAAARRRQDRRADWDRSAGRARQRSAAIVSHGRGSPLAEPDRPVHRARRSRCRPPRGGGCPARSVAWATAHHRPEIWPPAGFRPKSARSWPTADGETVNSVSPARRYIGVQHPSDNVLRSARRRAHGDATGAGRPLAACLRRRPPTGGSAPSQAPAGPASRSSCSCRSRSWCGWAAQRPGGISGTINGWIENVRGDVVKISADPDLHKAASKYYNAQYAAVGVVSRS